MVNNWEECILGDAITLQRGFDLPKYNRTRGRFPLVSSSGMSDYHSEAKVTAPGVVTGRYGTIGQVFYVKEDFWPLNTTLYVKDFKGNDPLFISYLLRTVDFVSCSDKSSVPGVNRNDLHLIRILLPPIAEQKAIAQILSSLDDKIELNQQMNQTLEAIARALFKSWFIDFDPVRAKMDDRQPTGMDAETTALFPAEFEDSAIGKIPKSWQVKRLKELANNASEPFDFSFRSEVIFLNTGDVACGKLLHTDFISKIGLPGQAKKAIKRNDILFSEIRPVNKRFAFVDFAPDDYVVSTKFMVIRASHEIDSKLLYQVLTRDEVLQEIQIVAESRSGTFPQITFQSIDFLPFVVPPKPIQSAYLRITDNLNGKVKNNDQQSELLAEMRDRLLPKLLSGEICVKDVEKVVEQELSIGKG